MAAGRGSGSCWSCTFSPARGAPQIAGLHDGRLKIRLAARAVEGAANAALIEFLAELFEVPEKRDVTIEAGESSRRKRVSILRLAPRARMPCSAT